MGVKAGSFVFSATFLVLMACKSTPTDEFTVKQNSSVNVAFELAGSYNDKAEGNFYLIFEDGFKRLARPSTENEGEKASTTIAGRMPFLQFTSGLTLAVEPEQSIGSNLVYVGSGSCDRVARFLKQSGSFSQSDICYSVVEASAGKFVWSVSSSRPFSQPVQSPSPLEPAAPDPETSVVDFGVHRSKILEVMRLNRAAFHQAEVLDRFGQRRPDKSLFAKVGLPRVASHPKKGTVASLGNHPASHYTGAFKPQISEYMEASFVACLQAKRGFDGTPAPLLVKHYYCTLPGMNPDIRSCFTFKTRDRSVSGADGAVDDFGFGPNGETEYKVVKEWDFISEHSEDSSARTKEGYFQCLQDGTPDRIFSKQGREQVDNLNEIKSRYYPTPTRPMLWVHETQFEMWQMILGGTFNNVPEEKTVALLQEFHGCNDPAVFSKMSKKEKQAYLCDI